VFNVLLQVLDDGRLTDNKGRLVNFKNTIVIMTSNLGSSIIHDHFEKVKEKEFEETAEKAKVEVLELLRQTIRPEFLNRVDEIIMFTPLTMGNVRQIVQIQLDVLKHKLKTMDLSLYVTKDAFDHIAEIGYDPFFGARPIKRVIQKQVLNELSKALLSGTIDRTKNIVMDVFDGKMVFRKPIAEAEEV
jgi:ATP-dependent Clp protease ATP-binding subunit ClpB